MFSYSLVLLSQHPTGNNLVHLISRRRIRCRRRRRILLAPPPAGFDRSRRKSDGGAAEGSNWNALLRDDDSSDRCELDADSTDEELNPVEKLEKFIDCEHSYSRYNDSHRLNSCCWLNSANINISLIFAVC